MKEKLIIFINGLPESGKTNTANVLSKYFNIPIISTDHIFNKNIIPNFSKKNEIYCRFSTTNPKVKGHFSISKLQKKYPHTINKLFNKIIYHLNSDDKLFRENVILIEGFVNLSEQSIKGLLNTNNFLYLYINNFSIIVEEYSISIYNNNFILLFNYIELKIKNYLFKLLSNKGYQSFLNNNDSDSKNKLINSRIENFVKTSYNILDVGCNYGYFTFELSRLTNGTVLGLDNSMNSISNACLINRYIYKFHHLKFICEDFFNYSYEKSSMEIIVCISTFHYFGIKQREFFEICHKILKKQCILLVEIEFLKNSENLYEDVCRKMDSNAVRFISEKYLLELIENLFKIKKIYNSVFQKGSCHERYFYYLEKI